MSTLVTFVEPAQQFTDTQIVNSYAQQKNKSNDSDLFKIRGNHTHSEVSNFCLNKGWHEVKKKRQSKK